MMINSTQDLSAQWKEIQGELASIKNDPNMKHGHGADKAQFLIIVIMNLINSYSDHKLSGFAKVLNVSTKLASLKNDMEKDYHTIGEAAKANPKTYQNDPAVKAAAKDALEKGKAIATLMEQAQKDGLIGKGEDEKDLISKVNGDLYGEAGNEGLFGGTTGIKKAEDFNPSNTTQQEALIKRWGDDYAVQYENAPGGISGGAKTPTVGNATVELTAFNDLGQIATNQSTKTQSVIKSTTTAMNSVEAMINSMMKNMKNLMTHSVQGQKVS